MFPSSQTKRIVCFICLFMGLFPALASGSPEPERLSDAVFYNSEVILDGHVDYNREGMVLFTSGAEYMVVLEGMTGSGEPGQHVMVVGYPYMKGDRYHINVTGYRFLTE